MTIRETRDAAAKLFQEIKDLNERSGKDGEPFSDEDQATWDRMNTEYDGHLARIETQLQRDERIASMEETQESKARQAHSAGAKPGREDFSGKEQAHQSREVVGGSREITDEIRALALQAWCGGGGLQGATDEQRDACEILGFDPAVREISFDPVSTRQAKALQHEFRKHREGAEHRAMSALEGAAGAFVVPSTLLTAVEFARLQFGGMRQASDIIRTSAGEPLLWPTVDDTGNTGSNIAENTEVAEQDIVFGGLRLGAHKISSDLIKVPFELFQDSAIDLAIMIGEILGERIGRKENTDFTVGDGASKAKGLMTSAATGVTTAGGGAITMNEVQDLVTSVDPAYRISAAFMFHDATRSVLRKLVDGQGVYIWESNVQNGEPDRLWGFPYVINQDIAQIATGNKTMAFGNLKAYKIRDAGGLRLRRLEERYADTDQVGFIAFTRSDGGLLDAGTNPVKVMLQA